MFGKLAASAATAMGSPYAFAVAVGTIVAWLISGPFLDYSDSWQLVINTGTTILTFLAVFLLQHSQNKDSRAMQLKLDELIAATRNARDNLIDLETESDEDIERVRKEFLEFKKSRAAGKTREREAGSRKNSGLGERR